MHYRLISKATLTLVVGFGALGASAAAFAQDSPVSPLSELYDCAAITSDSARLSCYDSKVAGIRTAEQNNDLVAIDRETAKEIKKEAFGFSLPSLPKLGLPKLGNDNDLDDTLVAPVKSLRQSGRKWVMVLENGQVWRQTAGRLNYKPKGDLSATIKPASLGTYFITLSNGKSKVRGLRMKRIE